MGDCQARKPIVHRVLLGRGGLMLYFGPIAVSGKSLDKYLWSQISGSVFSKLKRVDQTGLDTATMIEPQQV